MDLQIKNQTFLVCGATSGFGKATAEHLMREGAKVIGVARTEDQLMALKVKYSTLFSPMQGDITQPATINRVLELATERKISGALINAGGPPALSFAETQLKDWDDAYQRILRWKVDITQKLIPIFKAQQYGRLVYIESYSVKQPVENLVLSTSLRLAVAGMVKTVSQELSGQNINLNIVAPGSHNTPAIERLIKKKSELENSSYADAQQRYIKSIPAGHLGDAEHLASLAAWLLSPLASFVTGQVYALDGGALRSTL